MKKRPCKHCRRRFAPRPQKPNQEYCSRKPCQRARRKTWHEKRMAEDEAYRQNQLDAQQRWREKNPDYHNRWRESNPDYVKSNREKQRRRNRERRQKERVDPSAQAIAKMDVRTPENLTISGRYKLIPVNGQKVVKMDVLIVDLHMISDGYAKKVAKKE